MVLLEEFARAGCRVEFLDRPMSDDPHDQLLLQIRGAVAEYERALIPERRGRGRQAWLRAGTRLPGPRPPFGYRLDPGRPRDAAAVRTEPGEAVLVAQLFDWYLQPQATLYQLTARLAGLGVATPTGKPHWTVASVRGILRNPAYADRALNSAPAIVSTTSPAVSSPASSLAPTSPTAPDSVSPATVTSVSPVTSTPPVTGTLAPPVTSTSPPPDTTSPPDSTPPPPGAPPASVCQPDGTGCTKAGTYPGPDAVINGDYSGFKVVWTSSVVQPYSSGVPLYWTAYITYTNITSGSLILTCPGDWADAPFVAEYMSGGAGDDGMVSAESTYCSKTPGAAVMVPPGGTMVSVATFRNVPWPGSAVAIRWGDAGTSAKVYPFA